MEIKILIFLTYCLSKQQEQKWIAFLHPYSRIGSNILFAIFIEVYASFQFHKVSQKQDFNWSDKQYEQTGAILSGNYVRLTGLRETFPHPHFSKE